MLGRQSCKDAHQPHHHWAKFFESLDSISSLAGMSLCHKKASRLARRVNSLISVDTRIFVQVSHMAPHICIDRMAVNREFERAKAYVNCNRPPTMSAESQHVGRCSKCTCATSCLHSRLETFLADHWLIYRVPNSKFLTNKIAQAQKQLNGHFPVGQCSLLRLHLPQCQATVAVPSSPRALLRARPCKVIRNTGWAQAGWGMECATGPTRKMPHRQAVPRTSLHDDGWSILPPPPSTILPGNYRHRRHSQALTIPRQA